MSQYTGREQYTNQELAELDTQIQSAHDERVNNYLSGDAIKRYWKENQIPVRFGDLQINEIFSFARSSFDALKAHKKISPTLAIREDDQQIQILSDWWTGSFRI